MKIIVYGLGIIGGSLCASLKRAGYTVYGGNRSAGPVAFARSHGYIDGEATSFDGADVVILAVPPRAVVRILQEGNFPANCVVADICGVKRPLERAVGAAPRAYRYVGMHPMAGKETTGISSASASLFDGRNLILTRNASTDPSALALMEELGRAMGFSNILVCTAEEHDRRIALTSQLAHIVSNAYVKSPRALGCEGFTGGSFQDMTRVAPLDEEVWTELFFFNRDALSEEIGGLIGSLEAYRAALDRGDEEGMRALLREGKSAFHEFSGR